MFKIDSLEQYLGLLHVFSTADDGNMSLIINQKKVEPTDVIQNRKKFFGEAGIDIKRSMTIWLRHGDKIIEAKEKWLGKTVLNKIDSPKADAIITNRKNTYLALTVADCVPIILYDPVVEAVGLVHAGWKGVGENIFIKAIVRMKTTYGSKTKNIIVGIGPCIGKDSYIKNNFPKYIQKQWGKYAKDMGHGLCSINLTGNIEDQLIKVGIIKGNIYKSNIDVAKDDRFYSHYMDLQSAEGDRGRFLCVVGMKE